jgi:HAMP domain-containing protein
MKRRRTASWRTKLLAMLLLFSIVPMIGLAYWSVQGLADTSQRSTVDGLEALAQAKAEALDQVAASRQSDVERIASMMAPYVQRLQEAQAEDPSAPAFTPVDQLPRLQDAEVLEEVAPEAGDEAGANPAGPALDHDGISGPRAEIRRILGLILWDGSLFEEIMLIDAQGRVLASTFSEHEGTSAADLEYFQNGRKATYIQPVFRSPITGTHTMVIAAPMQGENLEQVGVVAGRLNLRRFLRLIRDHTGLGATGETVVAKQIDDEMVFMAPTRHDTGAALRQLLPAGDATSRELLEAAQGQSGSGAHVDYRGVETFASWQHVPTLEWGLLAKIDVEEAMSDVRASRDRMALLGIVIASLVVLASIGASRALVKPLGTLKDATDRISRGDFAVELDIRSNDEIGELADSFERMVAAVKFFREHQRDGEDELDEDLDGEQREPDEGGAAGAPRR